MRVAVLGAGAIGSVVGARLAALDDVAVTLIARGPHLQAIRRRGLTVRSADGDRKVKILAEPRLRKAPDLLILATKTQDLDAACAAAAPVAPDATVLTTQNGLVAERIAERFWPRAQVVGGIAMFPAEMPEPGVAVMGPRPGFILGRPQGPADAAVKDVAALLGRAGFDVQLTNRLRSARWTKLLANLQNAIPASLGRPLQECYDDARVRGIVVRAMREGLHVARVEGTKLEANAHAHPRLLQAVRRLPEGLAGHALRRRIRRLFPDTPIRGSTSDSLRRGRPTEIDYLNGEVVTLGRLLGVPTPWNLALTEAVHEVERRGRPLTVDELALWRPVGPGAGPQA